MRWWWWRNRWRLLLELLWDIVSEGSTGAGGAERDEREQKLLPTEMIWVGSTGGLAAAHTEMEQSRTPKPKFMLLQRHW